MNILVTGGLGYIGSHTCVELLNNGNDVIVIDNLSNSNIKVKDRIESITNKKIKFYEIDIRDTESLNKLFGEHQIDAVIHFAGLKAVGESTEKPIEYYINNVYGTLNLCDVMRNHNVKSIVFSSSATVYGEVNQPPFDETMATGGCTNPYGFSKYALEEMLKDIAKSDPDWKVVLLRYFNPLGAHESGLIGEHPLGIPNNLMPYITQVAVGTLEQLRLFGDDYNTVDGTAIRDYIHVVDLAIGHLKALEHMQKGVQIYNLGTGKGSTVLEVIRAFEQANDIQIPFTIVERRPGDVESSFADVSKAKEKLGFEAKYTLHDMCEGSYNWQKKNPRGVE